MDENRFFKFVRRFNGIVLMVAGVLLIGVLIFAAVSGIFRGVTHEREAKGTGTLGTANVTVWMELAIEPACRTRT